MSQKHRADVDRKFIRRFLIISLGCFGFMLWGLFDSLVTSPKDLARALAFEKLIAQTESGDLTEDQRSEQWESMCEENGWATAKPKAPKDARNYIYFQWFLFGIGLVLGLVFLWHYLRLLNAWVEGNEKGVESSWGQSLKFANIIEVNKTKWVKKGIAKLSYTDEFGGKKIMVFDDFKFHRETMGKIMEMAESHLTDEQIVGDKRESEKAKELANQPQLADEEE